jgi:hypothetical protein
VCVCAYINMCVCMQPYGIIVLVYLHVVEVTSVVHTRSLSLSHTHTQLHIHTRYVCGTSLCHKLQEHGDYVCMYVCIYVCMYVCMHVCVCVCVCVCQCVCVCVCVCVCS